MARIRKRACLQDGPFLDLHWLLKNKLIRRAEYTPDFPIRWGFPNIGVVASAFISANLRDGPVGVAYTLGLRLAVTARERNVDYARRHGVTS